MTGVLGVFQRCVLKRTMPTAGGMASGTAATRSGTSRCRPPAPTNVESALLPPLDDSILFKGVYIDRGLLPSLDDSILVKGVYRQGPGAPTG